MTRITTIAWVALLLVLATRVEATDRFFRDMEGRSESERYVVVAKSPDNRQEGNGAGDAHAFPAEGSPVGIHVSDSGHTVIYTGWQELLVIDAAGKEKGKIDILEDGFTKEENRKYVSRTTAGPMWAGRSHWYIIEADSKEYFVIRPWWGRHLVIDLATGGITPLTKSLATETARAEKAYVIRVLQGVSDGTVEKCDCCLGPHKAAFAAYLAGVLKVKDVIPALRKLESDPSIGSSTMGGYGVEVPEGRINPLNYETYTTRQIIHLALRRLGEKPGPFPCTRFKTEHKVYERMKPYERKPVEGDRHENSKKLRKGMSPEQVIDLLDCPDSIPDRDWQYDIDADKPYTLEIRWSDDRQVEKIEVIRPALWQEPGIRDRDG